MKEFIKGMLSSESNISSKRVCGVTGFIVMLGIAIYVTIAQIPTPDCFDTLATVVTVLLGSSVVKDVVVSMGKGRNDNGTI